MEMVIELKPCPFCGGKAEIKTDTRFPRYGKYADQAVTAYEVCCTNTDCIIYNADNKYFLSAERAAKAWNKRSCGWISVNDRLPEEDGYYFVLCIKESECGVILFENGKWYYYDKFRRSMIDHVTHWMPLPESPEVMK